MADNEKPVGDAAPAPDGDALVIPASSGGSLPSPMTHREYNAPMTNSDKQ